VFGVFLPSLHPLRRGAQADGGDGANCLNNHQLVAGVPGSEAYGEPQARSPPINAPTASARTSVNSA